MATILGEANLSTSFTTFSEDNRLAHSNNNRSVTTDFRRPLVLRDGTDNIAVSFDIDNSVTSGFGNTFVGNILRYNNQDGNDYLITDNLQALLLNTLDVQSTNLNPNDIVFNNDGTKLFVVGSPGSGGSGGQGENIVSEYHLSTAFDLSTASFDSSYHFTTSGSGPRNPKSLAFNNDGTKMFALGGAGFDEDRVYEYHLSTAFDVSTASFDSNFNYSPQQDNATSIRFNSDGTKMFLLGGTQASISHLVHQYNLSTGFDVSTASFSGITFSVESQQDNAQSLTFSSDGKKMLVVGDNDKIFQYNLSTGFDLSTATHTDNEGLDGFSHGVSNPTGIIFGDSDDKFFLTNETDKVYEFKVTSQGQGTTDPHIFLRQFNQSNEVAKKHFQMQFDFTEIDHNAVFNEPNSLEIQIDLQSHLQGHETYSGNQNSGTPNFGKVEAYWNPEITPTTFTRSVQASVTLTDQTRQTITLSIPAHSLTEANIPASITDYGKRPTISIRFLGTVNSPLVPLDSIPAGSNFAYSGRFGVGVGLEMRIFSIKARYTYTGRTNLTTGFIEPQGGDYNFTNLIPSDAVYKGLGTLWQIQAPRNLIGQSNILTLKTDSADNLLHSNPNSSVSKIHQPSIGAVVPIAATGSTNEPTMLYASNEYTNIIDDNIVDEIILETSDIRDPSLDLVFYSGGSNVPLSTKRLNIAFAPDFTGASNIDFAFSIADIDADQIHGIVDSELSDIAPSFTLTALGGLRLSDPQPEVNFSFTTEVDPSTAGLIKSYSSGVTQDISTSFTVTATASVTKSTTVSPSFSISVADTAGTVLVNTLTSSPIEVSVNFNIANPDADEVGVLHQVTSLVPAEPSAVVAIASLSDLVVIRAPSLERKLVRPTKTHTFKADPQQRTVKLEPFTRIIQAEMLKTLVNLRWSDTGTWSADTTWGSKTGKVRNIKAEQETRTVSSSQLDR